MKNFLQKAAFASGAALLALGTMGSMASAADVLNVGSAMPTGITVATDATALIRTIITLVIVIAALLTLFYLIMGAIAWITSGGDKGKVEEARNKITAAVIGLLILAAVWAIFQLVLTIGFGSSGLKVETFTTAT